MSTGKADRHGIVVSDLESTFMQGFWYIPKYIVLLPPLSFIRSEGPQDYPQYACQSKEAPLGLVFLFNESFGTRIVVSGCLAEPLVSILPRCVS
eukprot:scaffold237009_cov19-Prasinocladus_malaysianus.AAC.1